MTMRATRMGARRAAWRLALGAAGLAAGCDDGPTGTGGAQAPPTLCTADVAVTVLASGDLPTFAWSPACGITHLAVAREGSASRDDVVWAIGVPETRPLGPSVRYSQLPPGAEQHRAPATLVRGESYRVTVRSTVGGDVVTGGGTATFTF